MSSPPSDASGVPQMAFCHECDIEIRPLMTPDPTCPRCRGTFVEIMAQNSAPYEGYAPQIGGGGGDLSNLLSAFLAGMAGRQGTTSSSSSASNINSQRRSGSASLGTFGLQWNVQYGSGGSNPYQRMPPQHQENPDAQRVDQTPSLTSFLSSAFGSEGNAQEERNEHLHDDGMGDAGSAADGRRFNHDNNRNETYHQPRPSQSDQLHPEIAALRSLFAGLFGGQGEGGGTLLDFFGSGAPGGNRGQWGDYVVGQQGLDDIISQIMESTQGASGPPPAATRAIDQLERFTRSNTTRINKAKNQQCPTCKDDFLPALSPPDAEDEQEEGNQQDELVSMPCDHIFHVDCLIPWLQMHGTCPVCRVAIASSSEEHVEATNTEPDHDDVSAWPAPPIPYASMFDQTATSSVPGSFPTQSSNTTSSSRHFHPLPTTSTTVTSTIYTSPVLSPSSGMENQTQVVNSIVSSPPLVSDREEYFDNNVHGSPQVEMREQSRRAAEARINAESPWAAHLDPDELD